MREMRAAWERADLDRRRLECEVDELCGRSLSSVRMAWRIGSCVDRGLPICRALGNGVSAPTGYGVPIRASLSIQFPDFQPSRQLFYRKSEWMAAMAAGPFSLETIQLMAQRLVSPSRKMFYAIPNVGIRQKKSPT